MRTLTPGERRIIALGLLVGALALVWLVVVSPLIGGFEARAEKRQGLIARYQTDQRLLASIPALRAAATAQKRTAAAYQITAPSEVLAVEALKQRLTGDLTSAGGTVDAVQQVQVDVPKGWISVRADAQINLTQLVAGLRQLENETPYVVVEYASLGADRAARSGHSAPLDVRLQVSALFHPAAAR